MIFGGRYTKVFLKGIALILGGNRALYRERKVAGFFKERIIEEIRSEEKGGGGVRLRIFRVNRSDQSVF